MVILRVNDTSRHWLSGVGVDDVRMDTGNHSQQWLVPSVLASQFCDKNKCLLSALVIWPLHLCEVPLWTQTSLACSLERCAKSYNNWIRNFSTSVFSGLPTLGCRLHRSLVCTHKHRAEVCYTLVCDVYSERES